MLARGLFYIHVEKFLLIREKCVCEDFPFKLIGLCSFGETQEPEILNILQVLLETLPVQCAWFSVRKENS